MITPCDACAVHDCEHCLYAKETEEQANKMLNWLKRIWDKLKGKMK
jgi:hypothetical protein